ncbi:MAG: beta-lactamase family protein, partial [Actinobacteria bacterium]|nr:beta-lactamase family protein [Actinomycetota bacterium]
DLDRRTMLDRGTLFRVASITKTLTATAVVQLRDAGKLRLDDPLERFVPEFRAVRARGGPLSEVTLRRLLSHHAGLDSDAPRDYWDSYDFPSRAEVLAELDRAAVAIAPGSAFKYSNLAFALLGEVVARVSGMDYARYVHDAILAPLGMPASGFDLTDELRPRLATGYEPQPFEDHPRRAPQPALEGLLAAAALITCVDDLARWIAFQLGADTARATAVLSAGSLAEMHRPAYLEPDWSKGYGLAWRSVRDGDHVYLEHGGALPGYRCALLISKAAGLGVVVLTNLGWHDAAQRIALTLLHDLVAKASRPGPRPDFTAVPASLARLLGLYGWHGVPTLQIVFRQGRLRMVSVDPFGHALHAPAGLRPTDDPALLAVEGGRAAGEFARFTFQADGSVREFRLGGAVYRRLSVQADRGTNNHGPRTADGSAARRS